MEQRRFPRGFPSVSEIGRALLIGGLVGVVLGTVGLWTAYRAESRRRTVRTGSLRPWPAIVLFTSTDCDACDPVRAAIRVRTPGDLVREITYQGGAEIFRSAGIDRVPAVVVIERRGIAVGVFEGRVGSAQIGRALRRAELV